MLRDDAPGRLAVVSFQSIDEIGVLADDLVVAHRRDLRTARDQVHLAAHAQQLAPDLEQSGHLGHSDMESLVDAVHVLLAASLALEDGAQLADLERRDDVAKAADDELLQCRPQQADLADGALVELDETISALGNDLHDAVAEQVQECLANRRTRDAERFGERAFGEQLTARDLAVPNGAPDRVVALLGQALLANESGDRGHRRFVNRLHPPGPAGCMEHSRGEASRWILA